MILINSCSEKQARIELIAVKTLQFPSASAIEFYNNQLFVLGDDATHLLILDTAWNSIDTVQYVTSNEYRISKEEKPDIESAFLTQENKETLLIAVGSISTQNRFQNYVFSLDSIHLKKTDHFFEPGVKLPGIEELNLEGSAKVKDIIVFADRANNDTKKNHLVFYYNKDSITTSEFVIKDGSEIIGLSGLYYLPQQDLLLFTASIENTADATKDGAIGDSYLGVVTGFSRKTGDAVIKPDELINLSGISKSFNNQKVESVCVERVKGNELIIDLVADNDNSSSMIFKVKLIL